MSFKIIRRRFEPDRVEVYPKSYDILYDAALKMEIDGLKKGQYDLFAYCQAKEKAYEAKVHAANLGERLQNVDLVEDQK